MLREGSRSDEELRRRTPPPHEIADTNGRVDAVDIDVRVSLKEVLQGQKAAVRQVIRLEVAFPVYAVVKMVGYDRVAPSIIDHPIIVRMIVQHCIPNLKNSNTRLLILIVLTIRNYTSTSLLYNLNLP